MGAIAQSSSSDKTISSCYRRAQVTDVLGCFFRLYDMWVERRGYLRALLRHRIAAVPFVWLKQYLSVVRRFAPCSIRVLLRR